MSSHAPASSKRDCEHVAFLAIQGNDNHMDLVQTAELHFAIHPFSMLPSQSQYQKVDRRQCRKSERMETVVQEHEVFQIDVV